MSAASKTKRGESGKHNAETNPFRLNGGGCYPSHLRSTMRTVEKSLVERIGKPHAGSAFDKPR